MNEYPQVVTEHIRETDYFKQLSEIEQQKISDWLLANYFVNVVEGDYPEEDTSPVEITVFSK